MARLSNTTFKLLFTCCSCVDYLLTSLTIITSTHTNYFDRVVKEREAEASLSRPIIQNRFSLSTACRRFSFFRNPSEQNRLAPKKPAIITYLANLSTVRINFSKPILLPEHPAPKELRIIQVWLITSSAYFYF